MIAQFVEPKQLNMPIIYAHFEELNNKNASLERQNSDLLSRIYTLEEESIRKDATIDRLYARINEHEKFTGWVKALFSNKKIPMAVKLVLWQYHMAVTLLRPNFTDECQIRMDLIAESIGVDSATVRRATDKAEKWDLLARRYEPVVTENGEQRKYVHIALGEIMAHPEDIEMDKAHGGIRVKKCPNPECGSNNVDRYTVQHCRECHTNAWYGQPGLRADANVKDAQSAGNHMNHSTVDHAEKQDAFENETERVIEVSNKLENAIDRADRQIKKIASKKQNIHPVAAAPAIAITEKENVIALAALDVVEKQDAFELNEQLEAEHNPTPLRSKLQSKSMLEEWGPVEEKQQVCRGLILLNKEGQPAKACNEHGHPDKVVSVRECGSTRWQWNDGSLECAECWTPQA